MDWRFPYFQAIGRSISIVSIGLAWELLISTDRQWEQAANFPSVAWVNRATISLRELLPFTLAPILWPALKTNCLWMFRKLPRGLISREVLSQVFSDFYIFGSSV